MKHIVLIFMGLLFISPAHAQQRVTDPMRGLIWGLPIEAVKEFELATPIGEENGILIYTSKMLPDINNEWFDTYIEYHFTQNKLDSIRYDVPVDEGNPGSAMDDVLTLQSWLDKSFGLTSQPVFQFRYRHIQDDPASWGWAIYRGDGSVTINWDAPQTKSVLSLAGKDYRPRLTISLTPAKTPAQP